MDETSAGELDHLATLVGVQDAFLASIPEVDPDARVPSCGRWRVRDVVVHLGRIHHWAAAQASRTPETPLGRGPFELAPFYRDQALELRATLERLGPDALASTLDGPGPASFWRRRQTHETLVHLWDVRQACGLVTEARPEVWGGTLDEVVTVLQPRQARLGRMSAIAAPVRLVAQDVGREWLLGGQGAGRSPSAAVGSAGTLALMLWKRLPTTDERLRVRG